MNLSTKNFLAALICLGLASLSLDALARPAPEQIIRLATGDNDAKVAALNEIAGRADPEARALLEALRDDTLKSVGGKQVLILDGERATDAISGEKLARLPEALDDVVSNNRVTLALEGALAALDLTSSDADTRLEAVKKLQDSANPAILPLLKKAQTTETDARIAKLLRLAEASAQLQHPDKAVRLAAIKTLGGSGSPERNSCSVRCSTRTPIQARWRTAKCALRPSGPSPASIPTCAWAKFSAGSSPASASPASYCSPR